MKKIYIASPMFSEAELHFNEEVAITLEDLGFEVFLPQRSGYRMIDLLKRLTPDETKKLIFEKDYNAIMSTDIILIILDGRVIDEGACVELGVGYALGKSCFGLKTDSRTMMNGQINPMISGCIRKTYNSIQEMRSNLLDEVTI